MDSVRRSADQPGKRCDQVRLAQKVRDTRGSVVHEVRTSHRRTEHARTGAGGLFELDETWPGERAGDRRRAHHGWRAGDPAHADGITVDTWGSGGLGRCAEVPFGAAHPVAWAP
jgi:hypothetical protein